MMTPSDRSGQAATNRAALLWAGLFLLALAAAGILLAQVLGVHGFARGLMLGAGVAIVTLGGIAIGVALSGRTRRGANSWLPSRDNHE